MIYGPWRLRRWPRRRRRWARGRRRWARGRRRGGRPAQRRRRWASGTAALGSGDGVTGAQLGDGDEDGGAWARRRRGGRSQLGDGDRDSGTVSAWRRSISSGRELGFLLEPPRLLYCIHITSGFLEKPLVMYNITRGFSKNPPVMCLQYKSLGGSSRNPNSRPELILRR